jgi:glutamate-1-semialdehyde 2,1-aminomutase
MVNFFNEHNYDYMSNAIKPSFPDGLDVAIFNFKTLKKAKLKAKTDYDKQNVTSIMRSKNFCKFLNYSSNTDLSKYRLTIDEENDFKLIKFIFNKKKNFIFRWQEAVKLLKKFPKIFLLNSNIKRNQGSELDYQSKMWIRSKNIIPGGNMMLSKRPENILKQKWPPYFSKAKGCYVWDMNYKKFLDFYLMGVGTCVLGYNNKIINNIVKKKN